MRKANPEPEILVVEEDDEVRESLADLLTERGYLTIGTRSSAGARAILERGLRPRVLLLEPFTPNGGQQFEARLGAEGLLHQTLVIVGPEGLRANPEMESAGAH